MLAIRQLTMVDDTDLLPRAEEGLELLLENWDVRDDGALLRKVPDPPTSTGLAEYVA